MPRPRVLLLMPKSTYRVDLFLAAAGRLGVDVTIGSDRCHRLAGYFGVPLALPFDRPEDAVREVVAHARREKLDAIVASDDGSTVIASLAAAALGLPANPPEAAHAARNKALMRRRLADHGLPHPAFRVLEADAPLARFTAAAAEVGWPVVVKPLLLSGSRGVIRADDPESLQAAVERVRPILAASGAPRSTDAAARQILIERFLPGREHAIEALFTDGELKVLAVFDKPDPLDGPYFEETIYTTPTRLPRAEEDRLVAAAAAAATALGLRRGPVHAELRAGPEGVFVIEVAGRSIGGLCSKTLHFATGRTLEELILADALGMPAPETAVEARAAGVMMLPIPRRGLLRAVKGVEEAAAVPGIDAVEITAKIDHEIVPLPEGASYLGFLFARGDRPAEVEASLRRAHRKLELVIAPNLAVGRQ